MFSETKLKTVIAVLCALGALATFGCGQKVDATGDAPAAKGKKGRGGRGGEGGPVPVMVAKVQQKDVPIEVSAVGNVEPYATINVVPQIGGQLLQVFFQEGDYVTKGQKLFSIDPSQLEAQVAQAEATLLRDQALLVQAEANLARDLASEKYARDQATRYSTLFEQGIVSKEQGEQLTANADAISNSVRADRATMESVKAQIRADEANVRNFKVLLGYTTIYSPIDGRTGNLAVKAGNVVNANATNLVSIAQVQPIFVTFAVPETHLAEIRRYMAGGKLMVEATPQDGSFDKPVRGELTFVDNAVDMNTGTIKLKGVFRNEGRKLWPGEFVNVVLRMGMQRNALVVPNQAVQTGQDGTYVYVVNDQRAEMRPVVTGARVDQDLVVEKGLEAGETVVTEGQLRLSPGSRVQLGGPGGGRDGRGGRGSRGGGNADVTGSAGANATANRPDQAGAAAPNSGNAGEFAEGKGFKGGGRKKKQASD